MDDKKINKIEPESRLTDYLGGRKTFPKEIGSFRLEGEKSDSEIAYYSWDLSFTEVTDAKRPNNSGIDEVQIMFNLSRDIEWEILSDKTGTFKNKKISLKKDLTSKGKQLELHNMNPVCAEVFRVTGFNKLITIK